MFLCGVKLAFNLNAYPTVTIFFPAWEMSTGVGEKYY